jgi:hypothetical protein
VAIYPVFLKIPAFFYRLMLGDIMIHDGLMKDFLYYSFTFDFRLVYDWAGYL